MKKLMPFLMVMLSLMVLAPQIGAMDSRDYFFESYSAYMQRMTGSGMAQMRAEDARIYQSCDASHNCKTVEGTKLSEKRADSFVKPICWIRDVGSYPHVCVW